MTRGPLTARFYAGGALAAACAAAAASLLSLSVWWLAPLTGLTLFLAHRWYVRLIEDERANAQQMAELHLATIEALALAIDAKDHTTPNRIRRVQAYAAGLARALGMPETDVQAVKTAALLHDIGKLAIPDHILAKPGRLNPEELQKVQVHPKVGAEILRAVPFPYPVAPLILSHHERWDGRGYPSGLKTDEIPLGARILYIVEYFDALTSSRAYQEARGVDAAVELLKQESGKALDPHAVDVFVNALPELSRAIEATESLATGTAPQRQEGEGRASAAADLTGRSSVFDDIAGAQREIYALYQIAQAMGTRLGLAETMTLISSKLEDLIPFSACALFLYSDSTESLHCRFATGIESHAMRELTLRTGQGLTGWVARNRRPVINAIPSADLEAGGMSLSTALQSALVCPLVFGERLIGTLAVYHTEPSFYAEDHCRLLNRVCEQAAAVIHNSLVFEQTHEDSLTDSLTSLPNSRSLFQHLGREFARASRLNSEVSLIVMDVDAFKEINDTYGHHVGDRTLREVGRVLQSGIRTYDMCVRYAGDEFVVVLSGCAREEAEAKRQELQNAVAGIVVEAEPDCRLSLSISAGVAVFPRDGESSEALLAAADRRMYVDKGARKTDAARSIEATV